MVIPVQIRWRTERSLSFRTLVAFPKGHQPQGFYQEPAGALGCTLCGIDEQATKAGKAVAGQVSSNGTGSSLDGGTRKVNRELEPMAWALAPASIRSAAADRTCSRRARSAAVRPLPSGYLLIRHGAAPAGQHQPRTPALKIFKHLGGAHTSLRLELP